MFVKVRPLPSHRAERQGLSPSSCLHVKGIAPRSLRKVAEDSHTSQGDRERIYNCNALRKRRSERPTITYWLEKKTVKFFGSLELFQTGILGLLGCPWATRSHAKVCSSLLLCLGYEKMGGSGRVAFFLAENFFSSHGIWMILQYCKSGFFCCCFLVFF